MFEEAAIYRACFRASNGNLGPRDADLLTFWEIAVIIGVPTPEFPPEDDEPGAKGQRGSTPAHRTRASELNRQRLAHSKGLAPAPEARPVDHSTLNQMSGALS